MKEKKMPRPANPKYPNRWRLTTGGDLDAEKDAPWPLTEDPRTVAERLDERSKQVPPYGQAFIPPAPQPYTAVDSKGKTVNIPAGSATRDSITLFWKSGIGAKPADPQHTNPTTGLGSLGITAHMIVVTAPGLQIDRQDWPGFTLRIPGAATTVTLTALPRNPEPEEGLPRTPFLVVISAVGPGGASPASAPIPCWTT
ncbi:hypothetical protein [Streptomyces sp. NPDC056401]|uniref:hypothetical protein n=1 Tax=Streptomyces sp. NPDC056401 TaxID=3345809 RepID=UPI0035E2A699